MPPIGTPPEAGQTPGVTLDRTPLRWIPILRQALIDEGGWVPRSQITLHSGIAAGRILPQTHEGWDSGFAR